jgi:parallel beta-helix repeat protein
MNKKTFLLAILLIFVVCLSTSSVFAEDATDIQDDDILAIDNNDIVISTERTISPGATSDEIQNALDSMSDGDTLNFEKGTYSDICIYVNKSVTINGNGATLVGYEIPSINNTPSIITNKTADGGYGITNLATLYIVNAPNVTIKGLNIVAGANSALTYSNAVVYASSAENLTFVNNTVDGSSWGIYLSYCPTGKIADNMIKNQAVTGLLNFGSKATVIERNKVINAKNHGIDVRHGTGPNVQVINNTIIGSKEGIYLMHSKGHTAAYNNIINCTISSISCYGSSNIQLYNNTMFKSRIGVLLGGGYSNITVGANDFKLENLPYPPTFVYYIAEAQSDYQSAANMMGTYSDSSSYSPAYKAYTEIPTPKDINVDYNLILSKTGTEYTVPAGTSSSDIQKIIASMKDGDTLNFEKDAVYTDISIYTDKNIKIFGNNATLIGYDNINLTNVPEKITATTADGGYAITERAVLYSVNNSGAVISNLNIVSQYPGYNPTKVTANTNEYKTAGIRTKDSKNITITGCSIDGASWGIYLEYSGVAIVTNNNIQNQFTTGILNFGTPQSIIANNTITNAVNHGIDVRHGTGPKVTVFNNTITGSKEGIYLMHSQGHNVYNNTIIDSKISGITAYGSGNENIFNNSISGSRIGILLGGGYYNVTIGENTYDLDFLPFPPTFVTYLAKAESKYYQNAEGTYSDYSDTIISADELTSDKNNVEFKVTLTNVKAKGIYNETVSITVDNQTYSEVTDENGTATFSLSLKNGEYPVTLNYAGSDKYTKTTGTSSINIDGDKDATIISIIEVNGNGNVTATLKDIDGNALANKTVTVNVNNTSSDLTTDSEGKFIIENAAGKVEISYAGDKLYKSATADITLTNVAPAPEPTPTPEIIATNFITKDLTLLAGDEGKIEATLVDQNNNLLANETVAIFVDGEIIALGTTNENGTVSADVKYSAASTKYAYLFFFDSEAKYLPALGTVKITVDKKSTTLTAKAATLKVKKAKKISVTLKSNGKAIANKKVTIKVNGKTFQAKTNSKGIAKVSVKVTKTGKFTATVKFAGDSAYKAITKKVKITVKK